MRARRLAMILIPALVLLGAPPRLGGQENPLTTEQHLRLAFLAGQWE